MINELAVMSPAECRAVLAAHRFGRVAFASKGVPLVLPVNYLYRHPLVITSSDDDESRELRRLPVLPWASGHRQHWLKIVAGTVTGRRFGTPPTWAGVGSWVTVDL